MPTTDKRPLKVFLCHASTDKPKVRELYRYLKKRGIQPWFDEEDLVGGQDWQVEIPKALATSDAIIICLTKNSVDKEGYIQKEIKFALDKALEMPEGRIFLIPVKFEECEVPFTLSRYQWVDLTVESGYAKMMKALKFRASQLERSTVEVSKNDVEEENLAREMKEREAAEKTEQEQILREMREKQEHEAAEKYVREKVQPEVDKRVKEVQRQFKREIILLNIRNKLSLFSLYFRHYIFPAILLIGIAAGVLYVWKPFLERNLFPTPTSQMATETVSPSSTPVISFTSTTTSLPTEITDATGVTMRLVSAGEFTMGSDNGGTDEQPVHTVYLDTFYMDVYEVTNADYKACVDAGRCDLPENTNHYNNPTYENHPVVYVHWNQAKTYCEWRRANLPTEAQWEKAARGSDARTYPWGEDINCDRANYISSCVGDTSEVGSYEGGKSPYGMYDMAGNAWEWVNDWYGERYYLDSPLSNPSGPSSGKYRVFRGGAWVSFDYNVRSAYRNYDLPDRIFSMGLGFRCAKDTTP